jgi:hypothetical protein
MRKSNLGRCETACTTRLMVIVDASHRVIDSRSKVREMINTVSAPMRAAKYEIIAPVQGPKVYPDNIMSVEYSGIGAVRAW